LIGLFFSVPGKSKIAHLPHPIVFDISLLHFQSKMEKGNPYYRPCGIIKNYRTTK
jgi:hypothetical protein